MRRGRDVKLGRVNAVQTRVGDRVRAPGEDAAQANYRNRRVNLDAKLVALSISTPCFHYPYRHGSMQLLTCSPPRPHPKPLPTLSCTAIILKSPSHAVPPATLQRSTSSRSPSTCPAPTSWCSSVRPVCGQVTWAGHMARWACHEVCVKQQLPSPRLSDIQCFGNQPRNAT